MESDKLQAAYEALLAVIRADQFSLQDLASFVALIEAAAAHSTQSIVASIARTAAATHKGLTPTGYAIPYMAAGLELAIKVARGETVTRSALAASQLEIDSMCGDAGLVSPDSLKR